MHTIIKAILCNTKTSSFDFGVLHRFIDGTVDADRLDYINRDMLASGYIGGAVDLLRVAKQTVLVQNGGFEVSFFEDAILDIEHMLEMRFNLYKKVIFNHEFEKKQRYRFRESFGYLTPAKLTILKKSLNNYVKMYEAQNKGSYLTYHIVSFKLGVAKDFALYNGQQLLSIDEISTLRKRLKKSMQNTVPFFIYCSQKQLDSKMKKQLKRLFFDVFERGCVYEGDELVS